jgi:4-diphosphocytidyl-2-C-methyl-D-erythritol kinase
MIKKKAFAKLNLNLHVIPQKNSQGYHPVHFINTQLELHDELSFEPIDNGVEVVCDNKEMPKQEDNLVYKAALLMQEKYPQKRGIKITIKKNIPVRAGLGGGSSDAAVTVNTLSELWTINMTKERKTLIADVLGNDVHYFLIGALAEVSGDGNEIIPLLFNIQHFWLVMLVPEQTKSSTGWMYEHLDKAKIGRHVHFISKMKEAIESGSEKYFLNYIFNDFESDVFKHFPIASIMKQDLEKNGALKTLLCGSGLSMVGFFDSESEAIRVQKLLIDKYKNVIITKLN